MNLNNAPDKDLSGRLSVLFWKAGLMFFMAGSALRFSAADFYCVSTHNRVKYREAEYSEEEFSCQDFLIF